MAQLAVLLQARYLDRGCWRGSGVADAVAAKILRNDATGEYLEVIPELGGKTEGLVLRSKRDESLREVLLDHHKDPTAIRGNAGWKGAMLVPFANRIKNGTYTLNGETHYLERNEDRGIYGKIALHGYLYRKAMNVRPAFPRRTLPRCAALWGW